jgi:hypothetical protein
MLRVHITLTIGSEMAVRLSGLRDGRALLPRKIMYSNSSFGHTAVPFQLQNPSEVIYYSQFQLTTECKRHLLSTTYLRCELTENMSHFLRPLFCDVTAYMEACIPSRCLERGCITPLFYCCMCVMQGVYQAVA